MSAAQAPPSNNQKKNPEKKNFFQNLYYELQCWQTTNEDLIQAVKSRYLKDKLTKPYANEMIAWAKKAAAAGQDVHWSTNLEEGTSMPESKCGNHAAGGKRKSRKQTRKSRKQRRKQTQKRHRKN